jgi:hypothetical protein
MAFRNDPIVIGLRPGRQTNSAPPPESPREGRPDSEVPPVDPAGTKVEQCRAAYAEFRELASRTERRWQWIATITGASGIGLGVAIGIWQGKQRALAALPGSK